MKRRHTRLALHVLAPAVVIGCSEPPDQDHDSHDGRVQLGSTSLTSRNFDGRDAFDGRIRFADAKVAPVLSGRFADPDISATFDDTTGVTRTLMSRTGFLTTPRTGTPQAIALAFVRDHASALGLTDADLAGMEVTDLVLTRATGITNVYYRQRHLGLPVYNAQLHLNISGDGRVLGVNNSFFPNLGAIATSKTPGIGAELAVASAATNLSVDLATPPRAISVATLGDEETVRVEAPGLSSEPVDAQQMWLPVHAKHVALAWRFQVQTTDHNHWFDYTVDADSGKVWTRFDWTAADSYRAYRAPVESANHSSPPQPADGRVVITSPANVTASPLGWHNTGTNAFLNHRGNNVHAYDDRDSDNAPPATEPQCTSSRVCAFPVNYAADPSTYTPAALTNLFYWNNLIHDVTYQYGFDEVGGNFQVNNFGRGGIGNDDVRAEAQDGGSTNNANFSTLPDGQRARMQMFEFTHTNPRRDGDMDDGIIVHEYGHGVSNRLVGGPSNVSCLHNDQSPGEGISDWLALWFTSRATDTGPMGRGLATYALGQPTTGPGIRTQRYSTNPAINPWTYASINGATIPHGVGSVWAQVMWEVYWALRNRHGYSPDLYNAQGSAGNQRAMLYAIQGMKNTACSPTFVDMRDGIIQAATASHGGVDVCLLWEAFAAFGLGTNAISGGPESTIPVNGFRIPSVCCNPQPVANAGPDVSIGFGQTATLGTAALPDTRYAWLPGGAVTAQVTVSPTTTTTYTVTATTACGITSDSATVTVQPGFVTPQ